MNGQFRELEQQVDQQLAGLANRLEADLPRPPIAAVQAAVEHEVRRLGRRERRWRAIRPLAGLAAACVLFALSWPRVAERLPPELEPGAEAAVSEWLTTLADAQDQLTCLLEEDWYAELPGELEPGGQGTDALESLEESLQEFANLLGA